MTSYDTGTNMSYIYPVPLQNTQTLPVDSAMGHNLTLWD